RKTHGRAENVEQFRVYSNPELSSELLQVRPGNVLVGIRDPRNLSYLRQVLKKNDTAQQDVVVMTARLYRREHSFAGSASLEAKDIFDEYEQELFYGRGERSGKRRKTGVAAGGGGKQCVRYHRVDGP